MSAGPPSVAPIPTSGSNPVPSAEPIAHFGSTRGRVEVHLSSLEGLYDRDSRPTYPHAGPMIDDSVAEFLLAAAREQRRVPKIEVVLNLDSRPLGPDLEAATRAQVHSFFANEAELAALDVRVNRSEGVGSLWYAVPLVAVALLVAGLLYANVGTLNGTGYLTTLTYLVFITIVWVMLWDPFEVLLFDSYLIRSRVRACRKLAAASVVFVYPSAAGAKSPQ
ncbi:MAG TPA: hypothetical protein VEH28_02905 [Thermoplasmata archaeon]|nr:hypothetical protein [Thermoplasmata archaeon]